MVRSPILAGKRYRAYAERGEDRSKPAAGRTGSGSAPYGGRPVDARPELFGGERAGGVDAVLVHGIDPRQADTLHEYGIHTAGPLAAEEFGPGVIGPAAVRRAS